MLNISVLNLKEVIFRSLLIVSINLKYFANIIRFTIRRNIAALLVLLCIIILINY